MAVFFTADTHFGHAGAMGRYHRPFDGVAPMDEALVARWNDTVGPDDEVWHLGDVSLHRKPDATAALVGRLNGVKHLITGNNDGPETIALPDWASVAAYAEIEVEGTRLVLCHYPFQTWHGMYKGSLNLHGHSHGQLKPVARRIDVGVDVWDFRPVRLAEIRAARRTGRPADADGAPD